MSFRTAPSRQKHETLLEISGLHVEGKADDGWVPILNGVDLTVRRGEVVGVVGESGAGKSTLGHAAMAYCRPGFRFSGGSIRFDGVDLITASEESRRLLRGARISYVAQSAAAAFNPAHRLIDQTTEVLVSRGTLPLDRAEQDARELYRLLQLPDPATIGERYPHQVSGGQLQRVMTAMAMSTRPDLIVFDEPTTALDVTTQVEVLAAIRDLVDRFHTAAIYITHDLAVVAQMADRIKVLRHGQTVEEAPTRQLLDKPSHAYTRSLWAVRSLVSEERPEAEPILAVRGVEAGYGGKPVVSGIDIDVAKGRTVAVVGESGSGKSTLARVITGLLPPWKGSIDFAAMPLAGSWRKRSLDHLRRIQLVYQAADTALNPRQSVHEILARPLRLYFAMSGAALTQRVVELLEMIELGPEFVERTPDELSGGQRQRIAIARALAAKPDLIICDEVTSALDQIVQKNLLLLLQRLQKQFDTAYLFITHDIATVRAIADQVVVMHRGRIVEQGLRDVVLRPPFEPYTKRLLESVPQMDPDWLADLRRSRSGQQTGRKHPDQLKRGVTD